MKGEILKDSSGHAVRVIFELADGYALVSSENIPMRDPWVMDQEGDEIISSIHPGLLTLSESMAVQIIDDVISAVSGAASHGYEMGVENGRSRAIQELHELLGIKRISDGLANVTYSIDQLSQQIQFSADGLRR